MAKARAKRSGVRTPSTAPPVQSPPPIQDRPAKTNATPAGGGTITVNLLSELRVLLERARTLARKAHSKFEDDDARECVELVDCIDSTMPYLNDAINALDDGEPDSAADTAGKGGAA
jgi:hypothetical protein